MFGMIPTIKPEREHLKVYQAPAWETKPEEGWYSVLGLDWGQANDTSAATILKRKTYTTDFCGPRDARVYCTYLRKWDKGTDYCDVVEDVLDKNPTLIVPEFNGVGRAAVDMLRRRAIQRGYQGKIIPVVTAGSSTSLVQHFELRGAHLSVPKVDLLTPIQILQQSKLLRLPNPKVEPFVETFFQELSMFQMRYSRAGNQQFGNKDGVDYHDDLVISTALAAFFVLRFRGGVEPPILVS